MRKREALKFIKENRAQLERFSDNLNAGRITREMQKAYAAVYEYIIPKAMLCFTCGRSAQIMGRALLHWAEENKPKRKKK